MGALLVLWLRPAPAEMAPFFTGPDNPSAEDLLGRLYRDGHGVKQDGAEAAKWFRKAADQLSNDARADLGNLYAEGGAHFPQNYEEAYFWLSMPRSPHDGDIKGWPPDGRIRNTFYDFDTPCIYQSFDKAVKHLTDEQRAAVGKRVAEWKPPPNLADDLGDCRYNGNGAARNENEVQGWCVKAAEKGYEPAEYNLAEFYNWGRYGLEKSYEEAYFWWSIARRNMSDDQARFRSTVVEGFRDGAAKHLTSEQKAAADKRIAAWKPVDMPVIATAAAADDPLSRWREAQRSKWNEYPSRTNAETPIVPDGLEMRRLEMQEDLPKAEHGSATAQTNLGIYYHQGTVVPKDNAEAAKWLRKAADQGNPGAQLELGIVLAEGGDGLSQDYAAAYFWFSIAADNNVNTAPAARDVAAKHLTAEQIHAVSKRIEEWKLVRQRLNAPGATTPAPTNKP
jgi:hypothetical protein